MENKTVVIAAAISLLDSSITEKDIIDALRKLGSTRVNFVAKVETSNTDDVDVPIWVFIPADDSLPYVKVSDMGITEGQDLDDEDELNMIREQGVCTLLYGEYPRGDRYGAPFYAADSDFAKGVVGNYGFRAADDETGFEVITKDTRDDSCGQLWLKILVPNHAEGDQQ